jgi:hypothetical protein
MFILPEKMAAQNLPAYLPSNGLVAWYPFNGNANDESGNGNDGVVNGATLTSDRNGNVNCAFYFNGSSYIIGSSNAFPVQERSISIWFYSENIGFGYSGRALFGYGGQTCGESWNMTLDNAGSANGQNSFEVQAHCNIFSITHSYGNNPPLNQWHNWVATTNSTGTNFFLDGNLIMTSSIFVNNTITSSKNYTIGCYTNTNGIGPKLDDVNNTPWYGFLDDIAIYNRALTQEEITALYTGTPVNNNGGNTTANAVPPGIPYQAVVRNANGQVAANAAATIKFTLHQNTTDGAVEYQETHALTTNAQGLVSAVIGQGTAVQGTFGGINWSNTTKFLQVEVDLGNGYVDLGTQQLMSVPFALYAANGPAGPQGPAGPAGPAGAAGPQGPAGSGGFTHWVGESFGGGVVFHVYKDALGEEHGLIVSLNNVGNVASWGFDGIDLQGCSSTWDGNTNTLAIISAATSYQWLAAQICDSYEGGGFNDWYLPAIDELVLLFNARFQVHKTLGQISNSDVLKDSIGEYYWSSTEINSSQVKTFDFYSGHIQFTTKMYGLHHIRAIRSF